MPIYKLTYFDIAGFGEPIRYLLSILGEEFEDKRLTREEWPSLKPSTPFGKLPTLEVNGKVASQSTAISRYLGRKAGLAGKDDWEDLQIDMAVDTYHDLRQAISSFAYDQDEDSKAKKLEVLKNETMPFYFDKFNELIGKNNGYLANGKLSWGDIYFIATSQFIKKMTGFDYTVTYKNLKQLEDNVLSIPQVKKWNESQAKAV